MFSFRSIVLEEDVFLRNIVLEEVVFLRNILHTEDGFPPTRSAWITMLTSPKEEYYIFPSNDVYPSKPTRCC